MDKWSKEEMAELKKFWKGEVGQKYIKRMEDTKTQCLQMAMGSMESETAFKYTNIANGFDSVLQDIEAVCNDEKKKEEAEKPKK